MMPAIFQGFLEFLLSKQPKKKRDVRSRVSKQTGNPSPKGLLRVNFYSSEWNSHKCDKLLCTKNKA